MSMLKVNTNKNLLSDLLSDFFYVPSQEFDYLYASRNTGLVKEKDHYVYKTIATGLSKEDINISIENNTLYVKAQGNYKEMKEDLNHSIKLKQSVNEDLITASLDKGILQIKIPFSIKNTSAKKINIT
jgi:HSP20 family molecular chaperone IbpA